MAIRLAGFPARSVENAGACIGAVFLTGFRLAGLAISRQMASARDMDFNDLLRHYFGTSDLQAITPAVQEAAVERMLVDFGLEQDRGKRFALWSVLHLLGAAPDLDVAFAHAEDREAARNLIDLLGAAGGE